MLTKEQAIWILENLPTEPPGIVPNLGEWDRQRQEVIRALRAIIGAGDKGSGNGE